MDIMEQRYRPAPGGILDTATGVTTPRDYSPAETMDTVNWLNDRARGYAPTLGAVKSL
jgi:hypothetical protein